MDTVWVAYIRDRACDLYTVNPKTFAKYKSYESKKIVVGIYDSREKASQAIDIVLRRKGWRGLNYRPNCWSYPDRYEYGWKEIPFNSFNVEELYNLLDFFDGGKKS